MLRHLRARWPVTAGLLLIFAGIFLGEQWDLYYQVVHFDKILHFVGGIIAGWFSFSILQAELTRTSSWKQFVIIAGATALIGIVWEWAEYLGNFTQYSFPTLYHYFHGGDLADTLADLLADIAGGSLFIAWALRKERSS